LNKLQTSKLTNNKNMKNTKLKLVAVTAAAALLSTTAYSQVTVSGYLETSFITGSQSTNNNTGATKALGTENQIKFSIAGKTSNGWAYSGYQTLETDETTSGFIDRMIEIKPSADVALFYSYDAVKGSEIARTLTPYVTERHTDVTGLSSINDIVDVTSGGHVVGFDILNVGPAGQLSYAYNPNLDSGSQSGSDRVANNSATNSRSGWSVGYKVTPVTGLTIGAGLTKIDNKVSTSYEDATAKTLGFTYASAPFAIGYQRVLNEGTKAGATTTIEDKIDILSATFAASKEVSLGLGYMKNTRTTAGVEAADDTKSKLAAIAYNLGPVVLSINYEQDTDTASNVSSAPVNGRDFTTTKAKIRVNY
jgi:hypothetical protein